MKEPAPTHKHKASHAEDYPTIANWKLKYEPFLFNNSLWFLFTSALLFAYLSELW